MRTIATICFTLIFLFHSHAGISQYVKLFDFETATGFYPHYGALISDGTYLYGTTSNGGSDSNGVVFKIKKDGTDYTILHDFADADGFVLESSLVFVGDYLYGATKFGGTYAFGTIFKVKNDGTDFETVVSFDNVVYGLNPFGALFYDGNMLYGMATGGANNSGTIYKLSPDGSGFEVVFNFLMDLSTGRGPQGHLISDGIYLYGMTVIGGSANQGVVFRIKPDGAEYMNLVEFMDDPNGSYGYGGLVYDGSEYLYAMTNTGGEYNRGTIFKVKTDGTGYVKLLDMNNSDGAQPLGSLVLVGNKLYGMTELSGSDAKGNVFSIETDGSNFTTLVDFSGDDGSLPFGTLLYEDEVLYGMTTEGGINNHGVIFSTALSGTQIIKPHSSTELKIYPNPAQNFCNLILPIEYKDCIIQINSAEGSIVSIEKINGINATLELQQLPAGVYMMKFQKEDLSFVRKLIVE